MDQFFPSSTAWTAHSGDAPDVIKKALPQLDWTEGIHSMIQKLSFYPGAEFNYFKSSKWTPINMFIYSLSTPDTTIWLNGKSSPIHEFNTSNLHLTKETALDYLKFFCFFVRAEEGPFYVISDQNASYLPAAFRTATDEQSVRIRTRFHEIFQPPRYWGQSKQGDFRYSALTYYSNAIFFADFVVKESGMIEMPKDQRVLFDLPVKLDIPIAPPVKIASIH